MEDEDIIELTRMKRNVMEIELISLNELKSEIKNNLNTKAPGYDLMSGQVLKELSSKSLTKLPNMIKHCIQAEICSESIENCCSKNDPQARKTSQ